MKDKTAILLIVGAFIISFIVGYFIFDKMVYEMDAYYEVHGVYPDLLSHEPVTSIIYGVIILVVCFVLGFFAFSIFKEDSV